MRTLLNILVLSALIVCSVPAKAQNFTSQGNQPQQEWKTSTMQTSGSAYTSQVTEVGATTAAYQATTTESYTPATTPSGPRKIDVYVPTTDPNAPIGDAMLPLMLMVMVYSVYSVMRVYRRKRRV